MLREGFHVCLGCQELAASRSDHHLTGSEEKSSKRRFDGKKARFRISRQMKG